MPAFNPVTEPDPVNEPVLDSNPDPSPEPNPSPEPTPSPTPSLNLDADTLAAALQKAGLGGSRQSQTEPPHTPATPEQILEARKRLGYRQFDDAFVNKFGNLDTQREAIQELYDSSIDHVLKVVGAMFDHHGQEVNGRFSKFEEAEYSRQEEARVNRFSETYKELADPNLAVIRNAVTAQLAASGKTFSNEKDMFAAVAEGMAGVIRASGNPNFVLSGGSTPPKTKQNPNAVRPAPRGGGGGGGNDGDATPDGTRPRAASLFPKLHG